uniref:Uncharacterized protein n=1 Tax=Anguilla anguilla TaxID=7936 RepID=A0A0E9S2B0_ANGAN
MCRFMLSPTVPIQPFRRQKRSCCANDTPHQNPLFRPHKQEPPPKNVCVPSISKPVAVPAITNSWSQVNASPE